MTTTGAPSTPFITAALAERDRRAQAPGLCRVPFITDTLPPLPPLGVQKSSDEEGESGVAA